MRITGEQHPRTMVNPLAQAFYSSAHGRVAVGGATKGQAGGFLNLLRRVTLGITGPAPQTGT